MSFLEELGVPLTEREDGKVFPVSMDAKDVKEALLNACASNNVKIRLNSPVTQIKALDEGFEVTVDCNAETLSCKNLVIAAGGCSYPTTGSDGSIFRTLREDL